MAVMVHEGLFIGNGGDTYGFQGSVLHCAKDPWFTDAAKEWLHRQYDEKYGGPLPGTHGTVIRQSYREMALNLVDAEHPRYFQDLTINAGLDFITERFAEGDPVLVHCNMGASRSPSIAFLWMWEHGFLDDEFRYALPQFKKLYPSYSPGNGIWHYLKARCSIQRPSSSPLS